MILRLLSLIFVIGVAGVFAPASAKNCAYSEDSELGALCIADGFTSCIMQRKKELQKQLLWNYVKARETYHPSTFKNNWNNIWLQSSDALFAEYQQNFTSENMRYYISLLPEKAEDVTITFLKTGRCDRYVAQMRFQTLASLKDAVEKKQYIATIKYLFLQTNEDVPYKDTNPTGFKVLSYRIDEEILTE